MNTIKRIFKKLVDFKTRVYRTKLVGVMIFAFDRIWGLYLMYGFLGFASLILSGIIAVLFIKRRGHFKNFVAFEKAAMRLLFSFIWRIVDVYISYDSYDEVMSHINSRPVLHWMANDIRRFEDDLEFDYNENWYKWVHHCIKTGEINNSILLIGEMMY